MASAPASGAVVVGLAIFTMRTRSRAVTTTCFAGSCALTPTRRRSVSVNRRDDRDRQDQRGDLERQQELA